MAAQSTIKDGVVGGVAVLSNAVNPVDSSPLCNPSLRVFDLKSPILIFLFFHKALRSELDALHRLALAFATGQPTDIRPLVERYHFVRSIYKHHSDAEDEVIFPALDARVKNVAQTYSLEHRGERQLFEHLFALLDSGMHHLENFPKELASCAGALQTSINQHISKEEEQVFPLLIENFSYEEQASLVWQLFCSIPVNMMAKFLPWISSYLLPNEYHQMLQCLCKIVPDEKLLQLIVYNWMEGKKDSSNTQTGKGHSILQHSGHMCLNISNQKVETTNCFCNSFKMGKRRYAEFSNICDIPGRHPIDDILYWHKAIWKELNQIVSQAKEINNSHDFTNLSAFIGRLEFIAEVCIFHSIAEDNVIFPAVDGGISFFEEHAEEKTRFNEFRLLIERIQSVGAASTSAIEFNEKLCSHADQIVETLQKHFENEEIQVLPLARKLFSHRKQRELLYQSLCTMPLRSIERVLPWVVESIDEDHAKSFLHNMLIEAPRSDNALTALFNGWACKGQSGVACLSSCSLGCCPARRLFECEDNFRISDSEHDSVFFTCGNGPLCDNKYGGRGVKIDSESLKSVIISEISDNKKIVKSSSRDRTCCVPGLGVDVNNLGLSCTGKYLRSLSFSMSAPPINSSLFAWESENNSSEIFFETRPIDTIFKFHKAIRKDLEYLDIESGKLDDYKETSLHQFIGRFRLLWGFYRAHSNAEDDIVFPALESKESLINVSHSYMLDHKQEEQLFRDISWVLHDLSHLHDSLKRSVHENKCDEDDESVFPVGPPNCVTKYKELCTKLQGMCKSIRVALDQHVFREEHELWPLFGRYFSVEEQDKIVGRIIGTMGAEVLQLMLPWVTSALTHDEQNKLMDAWKHATKNTMFNEWLNECWKGSSISAETSQSDLHETDISLHDGSEHSNRMFKPGWKDIFRMNQNELESEIRKVYGDSTLDPRRKSYLVQNLITSRWIAAQQKLPQASEDASDPAILAECSPSFQDTDKQIFGCEHYKRNCKVRASCCGKLFTCRFCHDNVSDHSMDRKATSEMMCMQCLQVQLVAPVCSTPSCNGFSMAKYYCNICKFFDDERTVYHCPFCNLCRVGSGLGIDYFHCMTCNSCLGMKLVNHKCLEKGLETNCPICCDFLFTSSASIRSLPCGHFMHSACFQAYTCTHYTCPICRKSLGDMEVYFGMLDALLAAEQLPEEYAHRFQTILCNDCDKRGQSRFHWLYHKCGHCRSYNTRLID